MLGLVLALTTLVHTAAPCMDTEEFPLIEAQAPASRVERLSVRFKAEEDSGWYEILFPPPTGNVYQVALPKPLAEAVRVTYYLWSNEPELRTPEHTVYVLMGGCPGARSAPPELTEEIRVRRTSNDQPEIPMGFSPDGIRVGPSSRTTLGIVGGAAGGAAIAAAVLTGEDPVGPPPTPGNPPPIRACFTPDPIPDIESGDTVLFDASCSSPQTLTSFQWSFGDRSTGQGSSVQHLFTPGGIYTVTLTVGDGARTDSISRLVRVRATPTACFITSPDPPRIGTGDSISFNADCSVGDRDGGPAAITEYAWDFGDGRPGGEGRFVSRQFTRPDLYGVTLTVTNEDGRQDKTTQFVVVERRSSGTRPEMTLVTELALPAGISGQLSVNDTETVAATAPSPVRIRLRPRAGENVVEARLLGAVDSPGRWRFDFHAADGFVPGSLRVDSGEVLTLDGQSVVFRVTEPGTPIRFRFQVED